MRIDYTEVKNRAKFFGEKIFGFKVIPKIVLLTDSRMEQELKEYAQATQVFKKRDTPIYGYFSSISELGTGEEDERRIAVNRTMCKSILDIDAVLIHELCHYSLWWQGLEYHDGEVDFERKLKELGLNSNYRHLYINGKSIHLLGDEHRLFEYEEMYQNSLHSTKQGGQTA